MLGREVARRRRRGRERDDGDLAAARRHRLKVADGRLGVEGRILVGVPVAGPRAVLRDHIALSSAHLVALLQAPLG